MDGYQCRHFDILDWEIIRIGDEYYRLLSTSGHSRSEAELTDEDLNHLLDVYHYWKILLGCSTPSYADMDFLMYSLHFDVIVELFLRRKLGVRQRLQWILD